MYVPVRFTHTLSTRPSWKRLLQHSHSQAEAQTHCHITDLPSRPHTPLPHAGASENACPLKSITLRMSARLYGDICLHLSPWIIHKMPLFTTLRELNAHGAWWRSITAGCNMHGLISCWRSPRCHRVRALHTIIIMSIHAPGAALGLLAFSVIITTIYQIESRFLICFMYLHF